jgi:hypothetical protein
LAKGGRNKLLKGQKSLSIVKFDALIFFNKKIFSTHRSDQNDGSQHPGLFGTKVTTEIFRILNKLSKRLYQPDVESMDHRLGYFLTTLSPNLHRVVSF